MIRNLLFAVACSWLAVAAAAAVASNATVLSVSTPKPFDMKLTPTATELDEVAAFKLEQAMKSSLLLSASVTGIFAKVSDIDIVLHQAAWESAVPAALVRFDAHATFFKEDLGGSDLPTQFAFESLVIRTFSQPSTKATFLVNLDLSKEAILMDVENVEIQLVEETTVVEATAPPTEDKPDVGPTKRDLSIVDIFLIVMSSLIFIGILYCIYQQHKNQDDLEAEQARNIHAARASHKASSRAKVAATVSKAAVASHEDPELFAFEKTTKKNKALDISLVESSTGPGTTMVHESNIISPSTSSDEDIQSTPRSPQSSRMASSSTDSHSHTPGSVMSDVSIPVDSSPAPRQSPFSSAPSSPISSSRSADYLLGATQPVYSSDSTNSSSSTELSPLTARLLLLPVVGAPVDSMSGRFKSSVASAPTILMESIGPAPPLTEVDGTFAPPNLHKEGGASVRSVSLHSMLSRQEDLSIQSSHSMRSTRSVASLPEDRSIRSVRSVRSVRSSSSRGRLTTIDAIPEERGVSHSTSNISDRTVVPTEHSRLSTHFENEDWLQAQRKAAEEEENESSEEDVFRVDVDAHSVDDNKSRMSGFSAVSDWMKKVRVVASAATATHMKQTTSDTSAENSSIEPHNPIAESQSMDSSLEKSLAGSLVEV